MSDAIADHVEDASFLWLLRRRAVSAPHYGARELARLDERIEAHLDALRIEGEAGHRAACAASSRHGLGGVFTASAIASERGDVEAFAMLVDAAARDGEVAEAVVAGLEWAGHDRAGEMARALLDRACPPALRWLGLATHVAWRCDHERSIEYALSDEMVELRALGWRAVGVLGRPDLLDGVVSALTDDREVRFWAAWALARCSTHAERAEALWAIAFDAVPRRDEACAAAVGCTSTVVASDRLRRLGDDPSAQRAFLAGVATLGVPELVDSALERLDNPALSRAAAHVVATVANVDLRRLGVTRREVDDATVSTVTLDRDDPLPWPEPEALRRWWAMAERRFEPGVRHLLGRPLDDRMLTEALALGRQPQRAQAAYELGCRHPSAPLAPVAAPSHQGGR